MSSKDITLFCQHGLAFQGLKTLTWNKKHWGIKPVELQVKTQSNGFKGDQKDEIHYRYSAYKERTDISQHTRI